MAYEGTEDSYFLDVLHLFFETQWLYNTPVTDLLTEGLLDSFPNEWLYAFETLENEDLNDFVAKMITKPHWPESLKAFVEKCKHVNRLPTSNVNSSVELPRNFQTGLNHKKQHEIMHLAQLVHAQCAIDGIRIIVDLGAGLGYVSQLLHHLYGYRVLGLEKSEANVNNARSRQIKLYPDSLTHVKFNCCDLTYDSVEKIETILRDEFQEDSNVCLIGLHACGDLSVHASKIFRDMIAARIFIMIPCCYHKLSISKSIKADTSEKQYFNNFPLSDCLKSAISNSVFDVGVFLRQPFLRLACQEPADRWDNMSSEIHQQHSFHVLARAVLQLYANNNGFRLKKRARKGTRKSQCLSIEAYIKDSLNRYALQPRDDDKIEDRGAHDVHQRNIKELWKNHCHKLKTAEVYTGLQLMLQAPAESFVLRDRLCWIREQGLNATIVSVMNKRLSPRSYAIVSRKR